MTKNPIIERKLIVAYCKEKNLPSKHHKQFDKLIDGGKWKKYKRKRNKEFSDFDRVIRKISNNKLSRIKTAISQSEKEATSVRSNLERADKGLKTKISSIDTASNQLTSDVSNGEQIVQKAKDKIKIISKIISSIESKFAAGDKRVKLSKALNQIQLLKSRSDKSSSVIQANLTSTLQDQKRINNSKKKADSVQLQLSQLQTQSNSIKSELNKHKDALNTLKKASIGQVIDSPLLAEINDSKTIKIIRSVADKTKGLITETNQIDTKFIAAKGIRKSRQEFIKTSTLVTKANHYWINLWPKEEVTFFDPQPYYAYFEDNRIYPSSNPKVLGVNQNPFLKSDLNVAYTFLKKKRDLVKIKDIGWCRFDSFIEQKERDRAIYLEQYKDWLVERQAEMSQLKGEKKLELIKGILSQAQAIFKQFNKGTITPISQLDKSPVFKENPEQSNTPHELITHLRPWIELTEQKIRNLKEEENDNENAGSLYSGIDWNTRLKIPQYRTQSDNLISPETTCAPTTFTMMAERAGWSRADIITAIEKKFTDSGLTNIDKAWQDEGKAFLGWIDIKGKKNYQKTRGGKIPKFKYDKLAKDFKKFGQYEDLTVFYHYLINNKAQRYSINSTVKDNNQLRQGLENDGNFKRSGSYKYIQKSGFSKDKNTRKLVKEYLDKGDVVMFSIFHKGRNKSGTHNYLVQSINQAGFVIDDPFGMNNKEYRRRKAKASDLYKGKDNSKHRNKYHYKNMPDFTPLKKDYTKEEAQNLSDKESRGDSTLFSWKMMEGSDMNIINYIVIWHKLRK